MNLWFKLKCHLLACFAPDFWKDFPKENEKGPWIAQALLISPFGKQTVKRQKKVEGDLFQAYFVARLLAVDLDWWTPNKELGVDWLIERP